MRVIGTAGHVDHGKSTLVKRLTGIDPDRLAEEKAREMTIDLGFAWLALPNAETVGVVDVPGHRDFIENMLAGVGGIDAVLLVIAADEGIMPQTREHLAILDLLGIEHGLIVLSKIDMVDDPHWLTLVEQDILEFTQNTALANAEIVQVSAQTGAGIAVLLLKLAELLQSLPQRPDYHHPRLPVDRVFTMSGFGTVVTGTLIGGSLRIGDEIEIQPTGQRGRIRGLQSYKQQVEVAQPGSRVAVNVAGLDKRAVERGNVISYPRQLQATTLADARFHYLPDADRPLRHNAEVKIFSGTAESGGYVRLLGEETLVPGSEGWLQLRLDSPMALAQGDRFILRFPSPAQTIGGGVIVNPHPGKRWRRFQPSVLQQLETQMLGSPAQRVAQAAESLEPVSRTTLQKSTGYGVIELDGAIRDAIHEGLLLELPDSTYWATVRYQTHVRRMMDELTSFHRAEPLRLGMSREALRSRMGLKPGTLTILLNFNDTIVAEHNLVRLVEHQIHFNQRQQEKITELLTLMSETAYTPPSFTDAAQIVGEDVLFALIEMGEITQVQQDVIFTHQTYEEMVAGTLEIIDRDGSISAKTLRDRFDTSRKYAIGLLEHLDAISVTKRVGDERVRGRKS